MQIYMSTYIYEVKTREDKKRGREGERERLPVRDKTVKMLIFSSESEELATPAIERP